MFIHKYKTPRVLKGINKDDLPVWYYWNRTAWMQASVWYNYLEKVNKMMKQQNRNILLLADNAPTHIINENLPLSKIKLHFLPRTPHPICNLWMRESLTASR